MSSKDIKLGVSLYSYQEAIWRGDLDLEGALTAVKGCGGEGVEIFGEALCRSFPYVNNEFLYKWFYMLDTLQLEPVCYEHFSDRRFWQVMREEHATSFTGVPYSFEIMNLMRFFRMDLPDLKLLTQGGGRMPKELNLKFAEWCREAHQLVRAERELDIARQAGAGHEVARTIGNGQHDIRLCVIGIHQIEVRFAVIVRLPQHHVAFPPNLLHHHGGQGAVGGGERAQMLLQGYII